MRTLEVLSGEKRRRIAKETLEIYAPIANRLGMHSVRIEFEDLGFKAMYPMRSSRINQAVKRARGNRKELVNKIEESLSHCLAVDGIEGDVSGRQKHLYGIYKKMRGKRRAFNEIMDVYAFRIIVDKVDTCYRVLGAVHNLYKPLPGRFKDYIAIPKANGYQSLHTTLFGMHGVPIEIQIRTREMEEMANNGIAAHWLYKSSDDEQPKGTHARARQWVKGVLEMQQRAGNSWNSSKASRSTCSRTRSTFYAQRPNHGAAQRLHSGGFRLRGTHRCRQQLHCLPDQPPTGAAFRTAAKWLDRRDCQRPGARPNPAWLNFVVTGKARTHIRHALKLQRRSESINLGERLLNKVLNGFECSLDKIGQERIQLVLNEYRVEVLEDLLEDIGLGNRMAYVVARRLLGEGDQLPSPEGPLAIRGTEGLVLSYAKCCTPIPGDPIVGHLSAGKGMVVHWTTAATSAKSATTRKNASSCPGPRT